MEADSVSDSLSFSLRVRAGKMAAPQSGTSACARGQLLSSMATAPWQLARGGGRIPEFGARKGWNQRDRRPSSVGTAGGPVARRELRLRRRTAPGAAGGEVGLDCGRGVSQKPVRGDRGLACGGQSDRLDGFLLRQAFLVEDQPALCILAHFSHPI